MGGNALSVESVRLPAARYHALERSVLQQLQAAFPGRRIEAVLAFASKPDFGDMDLLIANGTGPDGNSYNARAMAAALNATEVVPNGDVTSIGLPLPEGIFQLDLIRIAPKSFDFACRYFSFNDLGNLLGRIAHKMGFKFGHAGLLYPLRDPDNSFHLLAELVVTHDFSTALTLLGYDAARYEAMRQQSMDRTGGFQTLNDIFEFTVSSPYANRDIYLLENRNHKSRIRDRKRPTYNAFLDWLAEQDVSTLPAWPWAAPGSQEREQQRQQFLNAAFAACPAFEAALQATMQQHTRKQALKARFNGAIAAAVTGLSGKALGDLMARVRKSFADEAQYEDFLLQADETQIRAFLLAQIEVNSDSA